MTTHDDPERRQMPDTLIDRLSSTDVDVVLVAALQAANELERTRWVSVTERLPPHLETVIVNGGIAIYDEGDEQWRTLTGEQWPGRVIQWHVTHWMPLPAAPEDSNE